MSRLADWTAIDEYIYWVIGIATAVACSCCCVLITYVETCHQSARKYETIEMMERRADHVAAGDHEEWDI